MLLTDIYFSGGVESGEIDGSVRCEGLVGEREGRERIGCIERRLVQAGLWRRCEYAWRGLLGWRPGEE